MIIWRYRYPFGEDGGRKMAFGCPVDVVVAGLQIRAVYQFQGGEHDQQCAVVHHGSGCLIAPIKDTHTGYPQERAQRAVDERLGDKSPVRIRDVLDAAPVINFIGAVV